MSYFELTTWKQRYDQHPEIEWLVPQAIEAGSFFAIVGAPGTGKTFLGTDLAVACATGTPWLGNEVFTPAAPGQVVLIAPEATNSAARRIAAQYAARGVEGYEDHVLISERALPLGPDVNDVVADLADLSPSLVLVDTWARATPGVDENSASGVGRVINAFDELRAACGTAVGIVHHTTKSGMQARGSSAFYGAFDHEFSTVEAPSGQLQLRNTKQKNAPLWSHALEFSILSSPVLEDVGYPVPQRWVEAG